MKTSYLVIPCLCLTLVALNATDIGNRLISNNVSPDVDFSSAFNLQTRSMHYTCVYSGENNGNYQIDKTCDSRLFNSYRFAGKLDSFYSCTIFSQSKEHLEYSCLEPLTLKTSSL